MIEGENSYWKMVNGNGNWKLEIRPAMAGLKLRN